MVATTPLLLHFVGQECANGIADVVGVEGEDVGHRGGVHGGVESEVVGEVGGVVEGAEDAAKVRIEVGLGSLAQLVTFQPPGLQYRLTHCRHRFLQTGRQPMYTKHTLCDSATAQLT